MVIKYDFFGQPLTLVTRGETATRARPVDPMGDPALLHVAEVPTREGGKEGEVLRYRDHDEYADHRTCTTPDPIQERDLYRV